MLDWREEEAANQARFRDVNESIVMDGAAPSNAVAVYVCECGDGRCREPIELSSLEYERVRDDPTHFAIVVNHENPEIDRVVVEYPHFAVVQKTLASAVMIARRTDRRTWTPSGDHESSVAP